MESDFDSGKFQTVLIPNISIKDVMQLQQDYLFLNLTLKLNTYYIVKKSFEYLKISTLRDAMTATNE